MAKMGEKAKWWEETGMWDHTWKLCMIWEGKVVFGNEGDSRERRQENRNYGGWGHANKQTSIINDVVSDQDSCVLSSVISRAETTVARYRHCYMWQAKWPPPANVLWAAWGSDINLRKIHRDLSAWAHERPILSSADSATLRKFALWWFVVS